MQGHGQTRVGLTRDIHESDPFPKATVTATGLQIETTMIRNSPPAYRE